MQGGRGEDFDSYNARVETEDMDNNTNPRMGEQFIGFDYRSTWAQGSESLCCSEEELWQLQC